MTDPQDGNERPAPRAGIEPGEFRRRRDPEGTVPMTRARAASPPETAPVTHGGYMHGSLTCDACKIESSCDRYQAGEICALDVEFTQARRRALARALQNSGHSLELHGPLIERAVLAGVLVQRMARYLGIHGDLHPGALRKGTVAEQPGANFLLKAMAAERQAVEALGLTPAAIAKIKADEDGARGGPSALAIAIHQAEAPAAEGGEGVEEDDEGEWLVNGEERDG